MSGTLAFTNVTGNKIDFYHATGGSGDRYGVQVQDSELRIHSGASGASTGGITFGKSTTTTFTEYLRIRNDGIFQFSYNTATGIANNSFNVAKTILGNIHMANGDGVSTNNKQAAITFQGGTSTEAQAGIYVSNNNSTGTAMGFATTDSYATGPQLFMTATNTGIVNFPRARPTYAGNTIIDTANYTSYSPTLTGSGASGTWGITITGNSATVSNGVYTNASINSLSGVLNLGVNNATPYANPTGTSNGIAFGGIESSSLRQYGIFTEQENIGGNYSKLTFNYHTGIRLGASSSYGGTRFYNDAAGNGSSTMIFSVGNGDNHVRVINNLIVSGTISGSSTISVTSGIATNQGNDISTFTGGVSLYSVAANTTSTTLFKRSDLIFGGHGGLAANDYATYSVMDTVNRAWIWRYATSTTAGTNVASIRNSDGAMALGSVYDGTASNPIFAQLNVCQGRGSVTNYRDIDMKGSWAAGEGHSITATHGSTSTNIVGQITFQHDSPGSRIKFGRIYHSGDQSTYPMELISSGSSANLYVTGDITAYYSDERLKTKIAGIDNALDKVLSLSGFKYINNTLAKEHGYDSDKVQIGMSAQEVQKIAPEIVKLAHFDMEIINGEVASKSGENYLTLDYSKLVPILVEAIKEQQTQIEDLRKALFNIIDSR
jgi:hypothetical protein